MVESTEPRDDMAGASRVDRLERENEELRREVIDARHSLLVNRDHVIGTEAEVGRLNRDVLKLQAELITAKKKIRALQKRKNGLLDRVEDLQTKLTAARARAQALRAEVDRRGAVAVPLSRRIARRLRGRRG